MKPSEAELSYLKLREQLKERMRKESGVNKPSISTNNDFGSFFGPSYTVIAPRVIQESKCLLNNPALAAKHVKSRLQKNNSSSVIAKPRVELQKKAQILKYSRDYSFLSSDDSELPAPRDHSHAQFAKVMPQRIKEVHGNKGEKICARASLEKVVPSKNPCVPPAKRHAIRKQYEEPRKANIVKKQAMSSSKSQEMNSTQMRKKRRFIEDEDDCRPGNISLMIRKLMGYNSDSKKFKEREKIDERRMEVGFDDIMKEERRSARAAKEEDQEELQKIQEEEEKERKRKSKKRKLSQH